MSGLLPSDASAQSSIIGGFFLDRYCDCIHNFIGLLRPDSMQVIGDLAEGLEVVGYAPDRIIEAVASKDPRRMFWAVQFHPEYMRSLAWASGIFSSIVESSSRDAPIPRAQFAIENSDPGRN